MTAWMRKMFRVIADGLACSARAVALHEGLPWDPDGLRPARKRPDQT
jgi:hypothetical protein